mmetsp:Transcript_31917/g.80649  ORF Transcript_31917/g.80649 Transcript_31917/m.80649 type:complete len:171 (+) Transcript_31917:206-718(+)|eukprot:jgi/Tetstr1/432351/TSEL_021748.t1
MASSKPPTDMSKASHAELDSMIEAQQKLLDNIDRLEKQSPKNQSSWARLNRAVTSNRSGASVIVMLAACTAMSLNMLSNKRDYQSKKDELDESLALAERARVRAVSEAQASEAKLQQLQGAIQAELRAGGWGMASRIDKLVSSAGSLSAQSSAADGAAPEQVQKVQPKMI